MAAAPKSVTQKDATAELASIKMLLQGIASDMSGLKSGMDAVQSAIENLGARMTEAESRISTPIRSKPKPRRDAGHSGENHLVDPGESTIS